MLTRVSNLTGQLFTLQLVAGLSNWIENVSYSPQHTIVEGDMGKALYQSLGKENCLSVIVLLDEEVYQTAIST